MLGALMEKQESVYGVTTKTPALPVTPESDLAPGVRVPTLLHGFQIMAIET